MSSAAPHVVAEEAAIGSAAAAAKKRSVISDYFQLFKVRVTPLKKISPIATLVGAFPGAMPPLLGWTAIRGKIEIETVVLFTIVFIWQFPHFQAIAWLYRDDYAVAGIKMLPVVDKEGRSVVRQMLSYS